MPPCDEAVGLMVIWGPLRAECLIAELGQVWPLTFTPAGKADSDQWDKVG